MLRGLSSTGFPETICARREPATPSRHKIFHSEADFRSPASRSPGRENSSLSQAPSATEDTVTVSLTDPGFIDTSTLCRESVVKVNVWVCARSNPAASVVTVYLPIGTLENSYRPSASVVAFCTIPVAAFVKVTVLFGIAAPECISCVTKHRS